MLQESVSDDMRGRTFATLYTVVRVCLLLSLTIGPFMLAWLGAIARRRSPNNQRARSAIVHLSLPGVRLALWLGGLVTVLSGLFARGGACARRTCRKPRRVTFIVLEGGEGERQEHAGRALGERCGARGHEVVATYEPGDTEYAARAARRAVARRRATRPATELLLMLADRAQHVDEVIRPALERGAIVVCDRFTPVDARVPGRRARARRRRGRARCAQCARRASSPMS